MFLAASTEAALSPAPNDVLPPGEGAGSPNPAPVAVNPAPAGTTGAGTTSTTIAPGVPAPAPVVLDATCEGYCDVGQSPTGCYCDSNCAANGDCCADQATWCAVTTTTTQTLPLGTCGSGDNYDVDWTYSEPQDEITALVGDTITFTYTGTHTVYAMASEEAYDSCDFTGAKYVGGNVGNSPFEMCTADFSPGTYYLACRIGSHCLFGQMKVSVRVVEIGPSLQAGLVEYFPEGNKTCATTNGNRLRVTATSRLAECYALCFDNRNCNFMLWEGNNGGKCTTYRDCSDQCDTSSGTDCEATAHLLREMATGTGTTYAVASGYTTCSFSGNDYITAVYVNNANVSTLVDGDFQDDAVAKTLMLSHFKDTSYTLGFAAQDSTPESCFDVSSFQLACTSTQTSSAWNSIVSEPAILRAYTLDNASNSDFDPDWYTRRDTVAGTATFTYNDTHWENSCDAVDNFWECAECNSSGTGKQSMRIWGCPDANHPCSNYAWFRLEVQSSAYSIHNDYGAATCPAEKLLATDRDISQADCYRLCTRTRKCTHFFFSSEEAFSVTGMVCRLYSGACAASDFEAADEPGTIFELEESCFDGRTNQDELYIDCGGVCDDCVCDNLEYGNPLVDGGCLPCTVLNACPQGMYYNSSYCPGTETLDANLTYIFPTDDTCRACTALGSCPNNTYWSNATQCFAGNGTSDDICQPCTAQGDCDQYFYFDYHQCSGDTTVDDSCQACRTNDQCVVGEYFDIGECDGTGTTDTTCQNCEYTNLGACAPG